MQVKVIFSEHAEHTYKSLQKTRAVDQKIALLKIDTHYGDPLAKKKIPKKYKEQYGITNLFRAELAQFWRMLYTITKKD